MLCTPVCSAHPYALHTCMLCTPVCSTHLYALHTCMLYTPVCSTHLYALHTCMLYTPVCSTHLYALYTCMLYTPVCSVHLYALHTCMLYTPVSSIVLLYLCSCSIFLLILILRLFGLNNKPHTLRQPHSQTLSSPERKTLVGSGHVAPIFLVVTNKINLCVCAIDLMKIKSFPLYIRLNKNKNLTITGTLILFFLCQNGFSCHLQYCALLLRDL